jgi:hypothetical protein
MNDTDENQHKDPIRTYWFPGHPLEHKDGVSLCMQYFTQLRNGAPPVTFIIADGKKRRKLRGHKRE